MAGSGYEQSVEHADEDGNNHPTLSPSESDSTATALRGLKIDDPPHAIGGPGQSPSEGKTFAVDPTALAQWGNQHSSSLGNGAEDEETHPPDAAKDGGLEASGNSTENLAVDQGSLAPGDPTEVGVGSVKKKRKKGKSKSKRGLVKVQ